MSLVKGSNRNTQCHELRLSDATFFFSYETLIGFYGGGVTACRVKNVWGPTTGRHIRDMGIDRWPIVDEEEMDRRVELYWTNRGLEKAKGLFSQPGGAGDPEEI